MTIDDFLRAVIAEFRERDVWDEAPTLALLVRDVDDRVRGVEVVVPGLWAAAGHPVHALQVLTTAVSLAKSGMPPTPGGLTPVGLMLVSEGYGIAEDVRPPGYWATHRIADDPAGYEYVSAIAVDSTGTVYGHDYRRGADDSAAHKMTDGRLVEALRGLLLAMKTPAKASS